MRTNFVQLLEQYGVDLVLCGHSHDYERSFLLHGHYGFSTNLQPEMILDHGSGQENQGGPYRKFLYGTNANKGAVYVVAGASSRPLSAGALDHPVMYTSFVELGSFVVDVDGNRLDARYLGNDGGISDYFTIIKEELPLLRIGLSANELILSWPATGSNFAARATASLDPPIFWNDVTNTPTVSGTDRIIRLSRPATNQFYRLERTQ